ncbi:unnamed protein product [Heterosigma akashiwo]
MATDIPKDRLEIKVLEARDLRAPQGSGVNPFAIVECADDFENTDTKTGNPNPVWGDKIMVFDNITAQEVEFLLVTLKHKDLLAYQDKDLGVVPVALATALQSPGITLVDWYPLRKTTGMGDEEAHGEVRLSVTYFLDDAADLEDSEEYDSEEDLSKTVPNALKVTVEGGRSLRNPGGSGPCDAYVILQCGKTQKRCKPVRKNNHPKWGFEAVFFNKDPDQYLYITVRQKTAISSKMIGQARVSMVEMAGAKFQNWVQLVDAKWRFNAEGLGEVQLTAEWVYDKKVKAVRLAWAAGREKRAAAAGGQAAGGPAGGDPTTRSTPALRATNLGSQEETEMFMGRGRSAQAFEEAAEAAEREAMAAQVELEEKLDRVKAGDYQMQVHVIEGRDLKGENFNGTSDPIVTVECFGQKRHTRVVKNVTNCLFGDVLYFNFKDLTIEQVQGGAITVACHDAERIRFNQLIGTYSFDFLGVYLSENHEIYRQWIGVIDNKSKKDKGPQGWIKLSITLLGPGDRQKVHNIEEEIDKELKDDFEAGQIGGMVLSGPHHEAGAELPGGDDLPGRGPAQLQLDGHAQHQGLCAGGLRGQPEDRAHPGGLRQEPRGPVPDLGAGAAPARVRAHQRVAHRALGLAQGAHGGQAGRHALLRLHQGDLRRGEQEEARPAATEEGGVHWAAAEVGPAVRRPPGLGAEQGDGQADEQVPRPGLALPGAAAGGHVREQTPHLGHEQPGAEEEGQMRAHEDIVPKTTKYTFCGPPWCRAPRCPCSSSPNRGRPCP